MKNNYEVWVKIKGFENYSVSCFGRVRSDKRNTIMKQEDDRGYKKVGLIKNKKRYPRRIHRLVAQAFISDYSEDLEVDHKDRDKSNNDSYNLQCVSRKKNLDNRGFCFYSKMLRLTKIIKKEHQITNIDDFIKYLKDKTI